MLYKGVVVFEPDCMILVTRYLSVRRVESEANNDLRSSLLGSDNISGLCKKKKPGFVQSWAITRSIENGLGYLGVMSAFKASESMSAKRFPSQQNPLKSVQ